MTLLIALGALLLGAVQVQAGAGPLQIMPTSEGKAALDVIADGTEILIASEPTHSLHWSPSRGFHYGRNCCKTGGNGRGARVSMQRFAGIDAAAGRPVYVRSQF